MQLMVTLTESWQIVFGLYPLFTPAFQINDLLVIHSLLYYRIQPLDSLGKCARLQCMLGSAFTATSHSRKGQGPHSPGRRPARRACSVVNNRWKRLTLWESCPLAHQGSWHRSHGLLSSVNSQAPVLDLLGTSQGTLWNNIFLSLSLFGNSPELIQPNELEKCS